MKDSVRKSIMKPKYVVPFFQQGRLLKVYIFLVINQSFIIVISIQIFYNDIDFGWAPLVSFSKKPNPLNPLSPELLYIVYVAVPLARECIPRISKDISFARPPASGAIGIVEVLPFTFDTITGVSKIRLKLPQDLKTAEAKQSVYLHLEVWRLIIKKSSNDSISYDINFSPPLAVFRT